MKTVTFMGVLCHLEKLYYNNGRTALQLNREGRPFAVASVNLVDEDLEDDEICIKDYSENEGMFDALMKAGVVSKPIRYAQTGFVKVPICKLLI